MVFVLNTIYIFYRKSNIPIFFIPTVATCRQWTTSGEVHAMIEIECSGSSSQGA